jgi:hypothetical protein
MLPTSNGDRYEPAATDFITTCHEATVIGVLPYGQPRTRCPPDFEYLGVWARVGAYPLKKVEDQRFNGVGHRAPVGSRGWFAHCDSRLCIEGDYPEVEL